MINGGISRVIHGSLNLSEGRPAQSVAAFVPIINRPSWPLGGRVGRCGPTRVAPSPPHTYVGGEVLKGTGQAGGFPPGPCVSAQLPQLHRKGALASLGWYWVVVLV